MQSLNESEFDKAEKKATDQLKLGFINIDKQDTTVPKPKKAIKTLGLRSILQKITSFFRSVKPHEPANLKNIPSLNLRLNLRLPDQLKILSDNTMDDTMTNQLSVSFANEDAGIEKGGIGENYFMGPVVYAVPGPEKSHSPSDIKTPEK